MWYGLSNIGARFLNYILTPIVTYLLHTRAGQAEYGDYSVLMAAIAFVNVIYTYGMETAYFRFSLPGNNRERLFQTTFSSLYVSTILFSLLFILFRQKIDIFLGLNGHPEYITCCVLIIAIDTMAAIPFARLRQEERPRKYAFTKVAGIFVNILLTLFFIYYSPHYIAAHPDGAYAHWYSQYNNTGFLLLANLVQNIVTFLLLWKEWKSFRFGFDIQLWKKIMVYTSPMIIVGLGGMVNETMDRIMLRKLLPASEEIAKAAVGIYSANYKLAIFITLFIQAFKMSAEPFFFSQSADKNAPKTYARVMKWFVITLCLAFLFTALYIDVWKHFIPKSYWGGLGVVPILLSANLALGIYYNLSVWYKIVDKMYLGMFITLIGAVITHVCLRMGYACGLWQHDGDLLLYGAALLSGALCHQKTHLLHSGDVIALLYRKRGDVHHGYALHQAGGGYCADVSFSAAGVLCGAQGTGRYAGYREVDKVD